MTERNLTHAQVEQVSEFLQGTCQSLDEALRAMNFGPEDQMTLEDCRALDDRVMRCTTCEWWCEASEVDEESVCIDCANHENEWDDGSEAL